MKRRIVLILALILLLCTATSCGNGEEENSATPSSSAESSADEASGDSSEEEEAVAETDLHYHTKTFWLKDLEGTHESTVVENGVLTLEGDATSGSFVTEMNVGSFTTMLASWNATTSGGSSVEMSVSFEAEDGNWSDYMSWGVWSSSPGTSASPSNSDEYGKMGIDILTVKSGHTATGNIKIRLELQKGGKKPKVRNFSITTPQIEDQQTVDVAALPESALNDVPMRSQLAPENGSDGNRICSPTTTVMALEYMGTKLRTMTAARGIYDNGWKAYGNWSYAVAYAGEKGYLAYLDLYDRDMMKYALSQGYVIGCSTSLTSSGHIVLLVGYTVIDGEEYYICNDPNVNASNPQRTNYKMDYFEARWFKSEMGNRGVAYVFAQRGEQ